MAWAAAAGWMSDSPGAECRQRGEKGPGCRPPHCRVVCTEDVTFLNLAFTSVFSAASSSCCSGGRDSMASSFLMKE